LRGLLDLILPVKCLFCDKPVSSKNIIPLPICAEHERELPRLNPPLCRLCALPLGARVVRRPNEASSPEPDIKKIPPEVPLCGDCRLSVVKFDFVLASYAYCDELRTIVHDWKFNSFKYWGSWLGRRMAHQLEGEFVPEKWDYLVPLPLYFRKLRQRGFNQAVQLAEQLSYHFELPLLKALRKSHATRAQSELKFSERLANLAGCFCILEEQKSKVVDSSILLVDDIYTTGATLKCAADELQKAGANRVAGLVLARSLPPGFD